MLFLKLIVVVFLQYYILMKQRKMKKKKYLNALCLYACWYAFNKIFV